MGSNEDPNILFKQLEIKVNEFEKVLILVNAREKDRIKLYGLKDSDSLIIALIEDFMNKFNKIEGKIRFIKEKVEKTSIKISFFGTVSAGKSRVLNTILSENLFLSAVSDTTSCFVKVCKSDRNQHYLHMANSETLYFDNLEDLKEKVKELSTHLNENSAIKLETNKSIEVFLNKDNNKILRHNTQIVDSPGSNNKNDVTNCVKIQSLDSDIFIFVMTYTLTNEERDFFEYQSTLSSKPDIFVLVNKWDKSDNDKPANTKKSKEKIKNELINLLTKDENFSKEEARKRIFFVSALEMYKYRVEKVDIFNNRNVRHREAKQLRYEEFSSFEESLSNYIDDPESKKLDRHIREVKDIIRNLTTARKDFESELFKNESSEEFQTNIMSDLLNTLKSMGDDLLNNINKILGDISPNLSLVCNDLRMQINQNNIQQITANLNIIPTKISKDLINIQSYSNEKMKEMKREFKEVMGKYKSQNKDNKPTLRDDLRRNIVLQMIPEKSVWGNIVGFFNKIIGTNDNEDENILEENRQQITSIETEMTNYVTEFTLQLRAYINDEHEIMSDIVSKKIIDIQHYWDRMKKILIENTSTK